MAKKNALPVTREQDFAAWYQHVVQQTDMAEDSGVRGCMIMRPWGYGIWERIQRQLDDDIKETGHDNCYFPLFIPFSYIADEAAHVEGFAKEMAVVTHHRLKMEDGELVVDPEAKLEEPYIVRPTSETVIGHAFARWSQSWRDLPIKINQWANVVRWELRTRMFLRTSEFLWQEGHTVHSTKDEAVEETLTMLSVYRDFAENVLAMPVIAGEKPENERFPGADATYSIEAMMQDGKALQAGTSHFLGQNFSKAQNIRYQNKEGVFEHGWTTSWGVSTRLVGGMIMTHGDDDGLRVPPKVAPHQIVIIPMLRDKPEDDALLEYCDMVRDLIKEHQAFDEKIRVLVDDKPGKAAGKRWTWVKKGAPLILEIGGRDADNDAVTMLRRDALYLDNGKLDSRNMDKADFAAQAPQLLEDIQNALYNEAKQRMAENIRDDIDNMDDLAAHFKQGQYPGWVCVNWSRPTGDQLNKIVEQLKKLKLTMRNIPMESGDLSAPCFFTGEKAVEKIYIARAY